MFPSQFANIFITHETFVTNLRFFRVEFRRKLQKELQRVTSPLAMFFSCVRHSLSIQGMKLEFYGLLLEISAAFFRSPWAKGKSEI